MIYMDNAAATRLDERVLEAMRPYFLDSYAVATSEFGHSMGIEARETLTEARGSLAEALGVQEGELLFTSGDTESSNTALKGVVIALKGEKGRHIVVSAIEDFPVMNSAKALERQGCRLTTVPVDPDGLLDLEALEEAVTKDTMMVSVQQANQEIGTLQDIQAVGDIVHDKGSLLHTDATHAFLRVPSDYGKLPVDLVTVSAHTVHGPKGAGGLVVKEGTPLTKWMDGGFQE
ncbi:MAG: aminotransferase class V-fold PLP-dependent enzyme, partial [Methanomassiliicoccales archaeon]|nr:aminotransferase class V-fold PLP-dependent enzyme [Methanomassiliicoccales archaeon]